MEPESGRRELKKQHTHRGIRRTAMRLFIERGFDNVTTAEIADASGVSAATLFNYFATKEDLFFGQVEELEQALTELVLSREPGQSILQALQGHVVYELTAGRAYSKPSDVPPFHQLVLSSARLRTKEAEIYERREKVLVAALTRALGAGQDPLLTRMAAGQYIAAEKVIAAELRDRLASGTTPNKAFRELQPFIAEVFDTLRTGVGDLTPRHVGEPPTADSATKLGAPRA